MGHKLTTPVVSEDDERSDRIEKEPIAPLESNECNECHKTLLKSLFYKYQLKEPKPICKECVIAQRKTRKAGSSTIASVETPKKMSGIYIITNLEKMDGNIYKVGKHTGSQRKLLSRYRTYLIDPIIIFYVPSSETSELEKKLLELLKAHRINDMDDGETEWVKLPLADLLKIVTTNL
jgi:hypothetical protein